MPDPSKPNLTILSGPQSGTTYEMDNVDNLLIGSDSSCPFFIDAPGISPIHARIWLDAEGCTVFDTHSPTGIYINDDRVSEKAPLRNGDILWLGTPGDETSVMIQVSLPGSGVPLATPAILGEEPVEVAPEAETMVGEPPAFEEASIDAPPEPIEMAEPEATEPPLVAESEPAPQTLKSFTFDEPETVVQAAPPAVDSGFEFEEPPAEVMPETVAMAAPEAFEFGESSEPPPIPVEPVVEAEPQSGGFIQDPEPETVMVASAPEPLPETMVGEPPAFFAEEPVVAPQAEEPAFFTEEPATIAQAPAAPVEDEFVVDETPAPPPVAAAPPPVAAPAPPPPPKPVEAKPAAPKPEIKKADATMRRTPAPAVAKAPVSPRPAPRPAPRGGGGPSPMVYGAVGFVIVGAVLAGGWYFMSKKAAPAPTPPPVTVAAVTTLPPPDVTAPPESPTPAPPPVEEVVPVQTPPPVTVVAAPTPPPVTVAAKPTPSPKPTPSTGKATPPPATTPAQPTAAQLAAQVAAQVQTALGKADASVAARNFPEAVTHFDEALKLEPGNARATAGKAAANAALGSLRKTFVPGKTAFIGKAKKGPAGFDDNEPADPDYQGRVDFEFSPANVKPGDAYTAKVYLANEGKKPIKVNGLTVATVTNGQRAPGPGSPQAKEVGPGQRGLLADVSGTWKEGTNNWSLDVVVTSGRGETYTSRANWR